jgi:hypothetical protein
VRSAYGVTGSAPTGKGRTIAILLGGYMSAAESDADRFFTAHGLKGFGPGQYRQITAVEPADPPIQAGLDEYGEFDRDYLITVGEDGPPDAPGILNATRGYDDATGIGAVTPSFAGRLART